ncbi:AAA family ATPase [Microvirga pakistanensis]|uniref:AAA family ATPase n=2 Tax=Microvirga pakistanensis TaxID=1682650 RepID=UPI00187426F3|nr:ATP-binding protein [Microvirga pakistanensis]
MDPLTSEEKQSATSTELTGGAGFTYEDSVVAYHLAALLREERIAGLNGIVKTVAVQQEGHGDPMDDIIVELDDAGLPRRLSLQAKRTIQISAANDAFRDILARAVATRATDRFNGDFDAYGFVVENVAIGRFRTLNRLIDWAKSSPSGDDFAQRFAPGGAAAAAERSLREELAPLLGAQSPDEERKFYAHFVALHLAGTAEGGIFGTEIANRLQELVAANEDGQDLLLFDRLRRIARDGAGTARKWTRQTLLSELRGAVRLKVAPNYRRDIDLLQALSGDWMADVSEEIEGFRVERPTLERSIRDRLAECRLVNLSGLPGCGKSAILKRIARIEGSKGSILFLKSDRLEGTSWLTFAAALGLQHRRVADLLAEISVTGTPVLFIDGIDRIRPDQKGIVTDILRAIEENEQLAHWKVLATSRDRGLEPYRAWFPASFYRGTGIGDVPVESFSDEEAEALARQQPNLRRLLFGPAGVREIARRPFFAAVLARSFPDDLTTPQTEVDLISAWWARAGHDAPEEAVPQRQRALLDLAETGVRNLGKSIPARPLKDATVAQIAALKADHVIRVHDAGAAYSFTHDIFFEWAFFRLLIDLGDDWTSALIGAGEPPLLGRVVGLLAQNALASPGRWSAGYRDLERQPLRTQWLREWLTAPPLTPAFVQRHEEFQALLAENDYALLEKLLVWFQAQHTIPSPAILQGDAGMDGVDRLSLADRLGWPSDFEGWGRLLDWLLSIASILPARLQPIVVEVFGVWQNVFADLQNPRSAALIYVCSNWLVELESVEYSEKLTFKHGRWESLGSEARSRLAIGLRTIIMRSARSYPAPAIALFERAANNERMRREAYGDLMAFTPIMAEVAPTAVVAVAKAELIEELPQDRLDREEREYREHVEWLEQLRAIPEQDRTMKQILALQGPHFPIKGRNRIDLDDIGIDRHSFYYHPTSPLHEPFAGLFAKRPEAALALIHDLANHATKGWRQVQLLNRDSMGTPVPVILEFPWGKQEFWGDWHVYSWFLGYLAPNPLECAFLSLSYWAFRQLEANRPTDEVIRAVVEGSECYAVLGLALALALETYDTSETTLPIVACQRLWHHDLARVAQEPTRDVDLFGFGFLSRLTGQKAKAKEFLDTRRSRRRDVRELAMQFALTADHGLQRRFKEALAGFPRDLPYEVEEARTSARTAASLKESAERWAGLGDVRNYRQHRTVADEALITYEPPVPLTPAQEKRLEESTATLQEYSVIAWATKSLQENVLADGLTLADAVVFAKARDNATILTERHEAGTHSAQTTITAVAAAVIRFGSAASADYEWAWDVMGRVAIMAEPEEAFSRSKIPWHPANHLVAALVHDRRSGSPRRDSVLRLFDLTLHPIHDVVQLAFAGLFMDPDEHVRWVAAQLAMELSFHHRFEIKNGRQDDGADREAREQSLARARERLYETADSSLASIPPAWVKLSGKVHYSHSDEAGWHEPNPFFDATYAAHLFPLFPVEAWCQSDRYKPMLAAALKELVVWTAERLMPSWLQDRPRRRSDTDGSLLIEWNHVLGDLLARAAPLLEVEFVRKELLAPFLTDDEAGLGILAEFADKMVTRHVLDAPTILPNAFDLLNDCVERVVRDPVFDPDSYRAGQVHGWDLPKLIRALLFVPVDKEAPGAARFANGDWSQVRIVMPLVTRLVAATGWSSYVMDQFLTLCERAGSAYPLDMFAVQANAVLNSLTTTKSVWTATTLPARTAATVQRLAEANFPLRADQARQLLRVLDALIDLGDRRSAALEQAEAFRGIQLL